MSLQAAPSPRATATTGMPDFAHVGYHRTGTNFLQERVFPALKGQIYRPSTSGWRFFADPDGFDAAAARSHYEAEQRNNPAGLPTLISAERLSGTVEADDLSVPEKLQQLNPAMRVIVVLRAQPDMFRSLYHLHVKGGGALRFPDFVERLIAARRCDYAAMVARLIALFGREAVLVLLYEDLRANPERFVEDFCRFLGVALPPGAASNRPVNAAGSPSELRLRRRLNAAGAEGPLGTLGLVLARKADALSMVLAGRPLAPIALDPLQAGIAATYAESNHKLAAMVGRPLGELGYPL